MKTILIYILLLSTLFCKGQQQKTSNSEFSLLAQSNLWSILDNYTSDHGPTDPYSYLKSSWYKIGNDTIINGTPCKNLLKSTDLNHENWSDSGFLRHDGDHVYFQNNGREILLYDFGMSVGDIMESAIYEGFNYASRLDSIRDTTMQNSVRKIYYLSEYPASDPGTKIREVWIEGIGSISDGLLRQTMLGSTVGGWHDYQLLCFHQNDTLMYQSEKYENCFYDQMEKPETSLLYPTNYWSVLDDFTATHIHPDDPYSYLKSTWYSIGNHSEINGYDYKQLMKSTDAIHKHWSISGHLRQDGDRVYYFNGDREMLLYDFGLDVGDTMKSELYPGINYVSRLDSVRSTTLNSAVRKIYYLTEYPGMAPEIWIEGIGSITDGLLRQTMLGITGDNWHDFQLLCFHQYETIIYQSNEYNNCYFDIVDGNVLRKTFSKAKIYPNPVSDELIIILNKSIKEDVTVELYSIKGELIRKKCLDAGLIQHQINLSELKSGPYILRLITGLGEYGEEIIFKK